MSSGPLERGIACPGCGASTPLPPDLRTPTFACVYCRKVLDTRAYAGAAAVSADALLGHVGATMSAAMQGRPVDTHEAIASAPRFTGGSRESRAASCRHCRAAIQVPLDLQTSTLTCGGCGRAQLVREYIADEERFALDMQRQLAGNAALQKLQADGVACGKCGGKNLVPDDGAVQLVCQFCRAAILLSDHVDATALARNRLKHGVYAMRDAAMAQQESQQKRTNVIIGAAVAATFVVVIGVIIVSSLLARH